MCSKSCIIEKQVHLQNVRHKLLQMWEAHFKISDNKFNNHCVVPLQKGMVKEKILVKNFHFK